MKYIYWETELNNKWKVLVLHLSNFVCTTLYSVFKGKYCTFLHLIILQINLILSINLYFK